MPGFLERFASKKDTSYDHAQVKVVPVRLLLDRISLVYSVRVVNSSFTFLGAGGGGRGGVAIVFLEGSSARSQPSLIPAADH